MGGHMKLFAVNKFNIEDFKKSSYLEKWVTEAKHGCYFNQEQFEEDLEEINISHSAHNGCALALSDYLENKNDTILITERWGGLGGENLVMFITYPLLKNITKSLYLIRKNKKELVLHE